FVETGQLDSALADLNTAISINAAVQGAYFWRGQVYRRKGDADHAIEDFSRSIAQARQTDLASYFARAQTFNAKGDYARAIADFDKVLAISPNGPVAQAAQQQRQSAVAMQAELAKVHDGQTPATASRQAVAAPPPPATSAAPAPATAVDPSKPLSSYGAGEAIPAGVVVSALAIREARQLMAQRKYADAVSKLSGVLSTDARNEDALRLRSSALMFLARFSDARNDVDEVLKQKPDDKQMLASRALASIGMRQMDQAM